MRQILSLFVLLLTVPFTLLSAAESPLVAAAMKDIEGKPAPFETLSGKEVTQTILTIHGSNTVGETVAPELVKAYLMAKGASNIRLKSLGVENEKAVLGDLTDQGKMVQVKIAAHGSSTGFQGLMSGAADIWASSRPVKESEVSQAFTLTDLHSENSENVVGIDGLAIIVHPNNAVQHLNKVQLARIFSGKIKNWAEVGGRNQAISIYARDTNSGTWDSFKSMVLTQGEVLASNTKRFESSEQLATNVSNDEGAIGFIGMAFTGATKTLAIRDGGSQGFKPDQLSVATEDYSLSRRLYLYSDDDPANTYITEFIRFANGIEGQNIVQSNGFVSQNPIAFTPQLDAALPQEYLKLVKGAKRLSLNFRFKEGSAKLDNKANKDIERLVYFLKQNNLENKLILVGFGDRRKNESRAKLLSKLRAMAVKRELAKLKVFPQETKGLGDFNAVASNDGENKSKNSRVEVWVK